MFSRLHIKKRLRKFPVLGPLIDVRARNHAEAILEIGVNIGLSTIPVWLGAVIMLADKNTSNDWWDHIIVNVYKGELFIYATALLGPLFYFIFKEYKDFPKFPSARFFMISSVLILAVSVALFAVQRTEAFAEGLNLDRSYIFSLSWKVYICSVCIVYLAYVYKNLAETGAAHIGGAITREFVDEYLERRRGFDE